MAKLQSQKYRSCIDLCNECFEACEICAVKCLREDEVKSLAKCVELCITCYHACAAASMIMSAESEFSKKLLGLVAEVSEACAAECEKHAPNMEHCKLCAEICRHCSRECRKMSE
jgi:hypothetical protein